MEQIEEMADISKVSAVQLDITDSKSLENVIAQGDVVIDLLPCDYVEAICLAGIKVGVSVVNTNYGHFIQSMDNQAKEAGIALLPQCGFDPGIDLILYGYAYKYFDQLHTINSYCGGFPEASACDNPINYKIGWTWEGVVNTICKEAKLIKNGQIVNIINQKSDLSDNIHEIDFPGLGTMEAIPNGDAVIFTDMLGITSDIHETGRYSLRWPGWNDFWQPLHYFGFLDETPIPGLSPSISPFQFLINLMEPQLQYKDKEKDVIALLNIFEGLVDGKQKQMTTRMYLERDLKTGLTAMSLGVGCAVSIIAQMIAGNEIEEKGVLSPMFHVPYEPFTQELAKRGISIDVEVETK